MRARVEVSQLLPAWLYVHATRLRRRYRVALMEMLKRFDAVVGPATSDSPPQVGITQHRPLGDPTFLAIWTAFGLPMLSLPIGFDPSGMPVGMQLVSPPGADRALIRAAAWCEAAFGRLPAPPER